MSKIKATTIEDYIDQAPEEGRERLYELYDILKRVAPKAKEVIKWGMPMFEAERILFAFAAFKSHLNLAATPSAMKPFKKELEKFVTGKGTIQFPYDKPLPKMLIRKIAAFRVKDLRENDRKWME